MNGSSHTVGPEEINGWLDTLEATAPDLAVNVIVEACHSGSFIDMMNEGTTAIQVLAQDDAGLARVVATYSDDGTHWRSIDLTYDHASGYWQGALNNPDDGRIDYFIQAVDRAGNTSMSANKGVFFAVEERRIYLPLVMREG